jgi:hypothetical protein
MVKDGYVSHPQGSCHACASESLREQFSSSTVVGKPNTSMEDTSASSSTSSSFSSQPLSCK